MELARLSWAAWVLPCSPGHPDVVVPLVLAAETAYLGFIGTHPDFRDMLTPRSTRHARAGLKPMPRPSERYSRALPPRQLRRFQGAARPLPGAAADRRADASPEDPRRNSVPRSRTSSSPISTACSGSICACSIPSTCSSDSSRAPTTTRSRPRSSDWRNGLPVCRRKKHQEPPSGRPSEKHSWTTC